MLDTRTSMVSQNGLSSQRQHSAESIISVLAYTANVPNTRTLSAFQLEVHDEDYLE
jgi:hypothetical protein